MFNPRTSRVNPKGGSGMDATDRSWDITDRANELYWGSDESVNQIAERLELSKSALYGIIGPLGSGSACPLCGAEAQFANRTARDRDELECPQCGWYGSESETAPLTDEAAGSSTDPVAPGGAAAPAGPVLGDDERRRIILGSALVGAGIGLLLARVLRWGR